MPKRKRDGAEDELATSDTAGRRLHAALVRGAAALAKQLRTARGFERQKLGRRQKTARTQGDDSQLARLEDEMRVVKVCSAVHLSIHPSIPLVLPLLILC